MQKPEMARRELTGALLQLKALGVDSLGEFGFPSPPPPELAAKAVEALHVLGALDSEARCVTQLIRPSQLIRRAQRNAATKQKST
jgi:HrpA-like RNA helicase